MTRLLYLLYFLPMSIAFAQSTQDPPPTAYTEPAGIAGVIVFLVLFVGSIALFFVWFWYRNKDTKEDH